MSKYPEVKEENISVNNYIETLLIEAIYREPNEETLAAMREAESRDDYKMKFLKAKHRYSLKQNTVISLSCAIFAVKYCFIIYKKKEI